MKCPLCEKELEKPTYSRNIVCTNKACIMCFEQFPDSFWYSLTHAVDESNNRAVEKYKREIAGKTEASSFTCNNHEWPYGFNPEDNEPKCVWCESLRADSLKKKVSRMRQQLNAAEKLLTKATPNPKFLNESQQHEWAIGFGKWYAEQKYPEAAK